MPILCLFVSKLEVDRFQAQVLFPKAEAKAQPFCVLLPKVKLVHNIPFPRHLLMGIDWAFFFFFLLCMFHFEIKCEVVYYPILRTKFVCFQMFSPTSLFS